MPVFNSVISRTDVAAMIPEDVSMAMLGSLDAASAVLNLGTRIPVSTNQTRFPVLTALPTAYWVNGDTGLKQTSEAAWGNKYLNIEELAVIVPIPENVLDDAGFDIWAAVRPRMEEAISRAIDSAVFFGISAPTSFPDDIVTSAIAAGNTVTRGTTTQANGGLRTDLSNLVATLESDGYLPTGSVANTTLKGRLRTVVDTTGQQIPLGDFLPDPSYNMRGLWPTGSLAAELVTGDFSNLIVGVRRDFTYKLITEGVITDESGAIIFNLPQQDMVALRLVFRMGWEVANPINYQNSTEATRYPFAVLRAPA